MCLNYRVLKENHGIHNYFIVRKLIDMGQSNNENKTWLKEKLKGEE